MKFPGSLVPEPPPLDQRLTSVEAAKIIGVSVCTLRNWRHQRKGPTFYQISRSLIFYARSDVNHWLTNRRVRPRW